MDQAFLGIDPGSQKTGYALVDAKGERLLAAGLIRLTKGTVQDRIFQLFTSLCYEIQSGSMAGHEIVLAGVEHPFVGHISAVEALAEARGAVLVALAMKMIKAINLSPVEVKKASGCGTKAEKADIMLAMKRIFNLNDLPSPDIADAMATALCTARRAPVSSALSDAIAAADKRDGTKRGRRPKR